MYRWAIINRIYGTESLSRLTRRTEPFPSGGVSGRMRCFGPETLGATILTDVDPRPHTPDAAEPSAGASPLDDLPLLVSRLHYNVIALVQRSLVEHGLDTMGLKPGMGVVLYALFDRDDQIISHLAQRVQLANSTVTGLLDQMERAGLITRHRDAHDGRAVRVRLTDRAREIREPCRRMHESILRALHGSLCDGQIRQAQETLTQMIASLRNDERNCP
jgi:DNA-binding MarR family transcriptional regulator